MLVDQIKPRGLGSNLFLESQQSNHTVKLKNFVTYIYTMQAGLGVI